MVWEVGLHIFIDESGTFVCDGRKPHSMSAVGALVIPTASMKGFEKLYGRLRRRLPLDKGEVKGRQLSEDQVVEVAALLKKVGSLFEVVAMDMGMHSEEELLLHKASQEKAMTAQMTSDHHPNSVAQVWELRRQLEIMPLQLYAQSAALGELVYHTLNHANIYYAFRMASELGEYHWTIDAKERSKVTPWEKWWSTVILPMLESHSFREPFIMAEGGDYRWHDRFKAEPSEYKMQFAKDSEKGDFGNLRLVMTEDFRFSSDPEFGLEAADILTNTVRRSMSGHFGSRGWLALPQLMIHRKDHYIKLISLSQEEHATPRVPYAKMINDFRSGGRSILPNKFFSD
jgi:hypothetical protein